MSLPTIHHVLTAASCAACARPASDNRSNNNRRLHKGAGA
jgi:hypothetical protein